MNLLNEIEIITLVEKEELILLGDGPIKEGRTVPEYDTAVCVACGNEADYIGSGEGEDCESCGEKQTMTARRNIKNAQHLDALNTDYLKNALKITKETETVSDFKSVTDLIQLSEDVYQGKMYKPETGDFGEVPQSEQRHTARAAHIDQLKDFHEQLYDMHDKLGTMEQTHKDFGGDVANVQTLRGHIANAIEHAENAAFDAHVNGGQQYFDWDEKRGNAFWTPTEDDIVKD